MTIRSAILRGSLALVFTAVLLSGLLSFREIRQSLQNEIARNLNLGASALMDRIDAFFFERLEDMREWHHLELMQDIRVGDVDKRLAQMLNDLREGHGDVYRVLFCTDSGGRVVAASDPALIGQRRPIADTLFSEVRERSSAVVLERFARHRAGVPADPVLRITVPDAFGGGELGRLFAVIDRRELQRVLEEAMATSGRSALLLDADSQLIAAAGPLAAAADREAPDFGDWYRDAIRPGAEARNARALGAGRVLVGAAASSGYQQFAGFGWHLLVVEPATVALRPVWRLELAMLGALLLTLVVAGWLSMRLASWLARPIAQLTEYTRTLSRSRNPRAPHVESPITEVGELCRAFAEMLDALERSREELVRAAKLAVVGEMAATMAHEVRTPLGILKSSAQMLERQPGLSAQGRELTGFIVSESDRLAQLVTALLECASPRPPQFQQHDLHEILRHVLALVTPKAAARRIAVESRLDAARAAITCDREQMVQVFLNLLINATQHAREGGHIALASTNTADGISVRVEDNGGGIAEPDRERVFDTFFTRREGGVGLGLTIVERIVHAHHGHIEVGTSRWGGAGFDVRLPLTGGSATVSSRILIVDDEEKMRRLLEMALLAMGHTVVQAADGREALERTLEAPFDLVLTDLRMPRMDGIGLLRALREQGDNVPVVVLTAHGSIESAVDAMKLGAVDYIIRPFEMSTVELAVTRALAMEQVQRENRFLRDEIARGWGEFIGQGPAMAELYALIRQIAGARSSVFIVGETGTGKELVARALHRESGRGGLFVATNCAAIPAELLESELFGYRKGAFSGATRDHMGRFELASGGTLFLDEITEMPLLLQSKLLRVLQENAVERLGSHVSVALDLRIVAATNRDPREAVAAGRLRQDLYYRLNVVRVDVPPLRRRREDIPLLAAHFLEQYSREMGRPVPHLAPVTLERLLAYDWPGNIRELENLIERAVVLLRGDTVTPELLPAELTTREPAALATQAQTDAAPEQLDLPSQVDALEQRLIVEALQRSRDNKSAAARLLGISERSLWYRIKRFGL